MPYLKTIPPAQATGELAELYAEIQRIRGRVANIYQVQSLDPELLRAHRDFYWSTMHRAEGLPPIEREALALAVSVANGCDYCTRHHAEHLREAGGGESLILSLSLSEAPLTDSPRLKRLIYYARKLTLLPNSMGKEDVDALRVVGLSELEILHCAQIVSYYNYVNRIANGLGVELENTGK
jgi:uncharacterized peroxidase-related enzyme